MILVLLQDGFEEIEALTPVDMLRRAGEDVRTVGLCGDVAVGTHGIRVVPDMTADALPQTGIDMVILPGGMPGAKDLDASDAVDVLLRRVYDGGGHLAAICAAPMVLGHRGYLEGKRATCFPGFEEHLRGAQVCDVPAVTDGRITTGQSVYTAMAFAEELVRVMKARREESV